MNGYDEWPPMEQQQTLDLFKSLSTWARGDQRAPHKPLLILLALSRWQQGNPAPLPFAAIEPDLTTLLKEFGPPRQSYHPEYPFWRLQSDGVWVVGSAEPMKSRASNNDVLKSELIAKNATGEFSSEIRAALAADPGLVARIASLMLERHFPESLHQDIVNAVGLSLEASTGPKRRDPQFRQRVLKAYEYRCAVCGFDVRLGSVSIALDAAHIRWHQADGPDVESNGLALCVLHHKTFDLGAFTVCDGVLLVSDQANGTTGFQEALMTHHGKPVRPAQRPDWNPAPEHLEWHIREVFKGEARHRI